MHKFPALTVFEQWRRACQLATDAECALADATLRYFYGTAAAPPGEAEHRLSASLRATATDLYRQAMAEVARVSAQAEEVSSHPSPWAREQRARFTPPPDR